MLKKSGNIKKAVEEVNRKYINKYYKDVLTNNLKYKVMIETTNICNARCEFCANPTLMRKKMIMSDEVFNKIINRLIKEKLEVEAFILHLNGEPLIDKKIFHRVNVLKEKFPNAQIRFTSNFALANRDIIDELLNSNLDELTISLNSIDKDEYTRIMKINDYDKTLSNVDFLLNRKKELQSGLKINVSIVARPEDKEKVDKFKKTWNNKANVRVMKLGKWIDDEKSDSMIVKQKNNSMCKDIYKQICLLSNGDFALCCFDCEGIIGKNIMKSSIRRGFNSSVYRKIRRAQVQNGRNIEQCKSCSFNQV